MKVASSPENLRIYAIKVLINCYLKRENYKVLKFYLNNSSYFEISTSPFQAPPSNKRYA